jgi:hypothetical protein
MAEERKAGTSYQTTIAPVPMFAGADFQQPPASLNRNGQAEENSLRRRTLDIIFAGGGALLAVLFVVLAYVLADQASFAHSYVKDQLGQQKIVFASAETLTQADKTWAPGSVCLSDNAGQLMQTGKQAECYANFYIGMHISNAAIAAGYNGQTYATLGTEQANLRAAIATAKTKGDTAAADSGQKQLDAATGLRTTMQTGETLRGLLLTSYGFSIFGEKAAVAAIVCYIAAALMGLLATAGFIHAFVTPKEKTVFAVAPAAPRPSGTAEPA